MAEILTMVALAFTGKATVVRCVPYNGLPAKVAGLTYYGHPNKVIVRRWTCRNVLTAKPDPWALDTLTHELVHVRHPEVPHGRRFQRIVDRNMPVVARLIRRFK